MESSLFQQAVDISAETLGQDLMALVLQEVKALPDVWQRMNERKQNEVIDRVRDNIEHAVNRTVCIIASQGCVRVNGELKKVTIAGKKEALIAIESGNCSESLNALYESCGDPVVVVVASPEQFTGGMDEIQADPDQADAFCEPNDTPSTDDIDEMEDNILLEAFE